MSHDTEQRNGLDEEILRAGRLWADALPALARAAEAPFSEPAAEHL